MGVYLSYTLLSYDTYKEKIAEWGCKMRETNTKYSGQYSCSLCTKTFKKPNVDTLKVRIHAVADITDL